LERHPLAGPLGEWTRERVLPAATSAVVSAFATPILGGIAGPVTSFVLDKLRGK
jgi:hypothetical protein